LSQQRSSKASARDFERTSLPPDSLAARFVLACMASIGLMYANVSPVIVSGLIEAGLGTEDAAFVFSANMYGSAIGAFLIIGIVPRLPWRLSVVCLVCALILTDLLSIWTLDPGRLYLVRFVHGLLGGASVGISFSVIARTTSPERTFGFLLVVQAGLGGLGTALLTPLLHSTGVWIVWLSLIGFSVITLVLITRLSEYPQSGATPGQWLVSRTVLGALPIAVLIAIFLYQAGQNATFSFLLELAASREMETNAASFLVAIGQWVSVPGALLVVWWSTRNGRFLPATLGIAATAISLTILLDDSPGAFLLGNVLFGVAFAVTLPYLLGIASELDATGQLAALGGFASKMGLATGPALAGLIAGSGRIETVIFLSLVLLGLSMVAVVRPSRALDHRNPSEEAVATADRQG